jgi:hypothetical protein
MDSQPRGIRNFNPLNIDKNAKNKWQGKVTPSKDRRFETFETPVYGIRAGAVLVINHFDKKKANTIRKLINIWAPPVENDTGSYAHAVAKAAGVGPDDEVNFHEYVILRPVIEAMILHENGIQPYTDAQIDKGLAMAGVVPSKSMKKSRTIGGATVSAVGTGGAAVTQMVSDAQVAIGPLTDYLDIAKYLMLGLIIIGIGVTVYAKWDDIRKLRT